MNKKIFLLILAIFIVGLTVMPFSTAENVTKNTTETSNLTANLGEAQTALAEGIGFLSSHIPQLKDKMPDQLDYYLRFKKNVLPEGSDYFLKKFYFDTALAAHHILLPHLELW